jgi:hypothetical protein
MENHVSARGRERARRLLQEMPELSDLYTDAQLAEIGERLGIRPHEPIRCTELAKIPLEEIHRRINARTKKCQRSSLGQIVREIREEKRYGNHQNHKRTTRQ